MQLKKGQSAIEFVMTYSYVFLIIAIAISVLLLFLSIPKTTIPFQCNGYGAFTCTDAALVKNTNGATLIILTLDNQPGIVNVTSFNAFLNYQSSSGGFCTPSRVTAGQYMYCMTNFTFAPVLSNIYQGTYNISANYCVNGVQNATTGACAASTSFIFSGTLRIQPSVQNSLTSTLNSLIGNAPFTEYYVPVTITNNQPVATPTPFQVLIQFPSNSYPGYINSGWSNVEFSTAPGGRGTLLGAWIETGASNSIANTMVWLNLPNGIGANSTSTVYANFLPINVLSAYGPTGESPSISSTYAAYDNGQYVFNFYDNFNGTALSSKWSNTGGIVVNDGLTIVSSTTPNFIYTPTQYSSFNNVLDVYWNSVAPASSNLNFGFNSRATPQLNTLFWKGSAGAFTTTSANSQGPHIIQSGLSYSGYYIFSLYTNSTNAIALTSLQGNELKGTTVYKSSLNIFRGTGPIMIQNNGAGGIASGVSLQVGWVRLRGAPPNGVMPTTSYGQIVQVT